MNFVWVYYHNAAKNDELRFSMRSVLANFKGTAKISLVGDAPPWYCGHHIPVERVAGPNNYRTFRDSFNKVLTAANSPEIENDFVWCMDDVYFLNPFTEEQLRQPRHMGRICERTAARLKGNKWQRLKRRTAERVGLGCFDYATHLPHVLNQERFLAMVDKYNMPQELYIWEILYGHEYYKNPVHYSPFLARTQTRPTYEKMAEHCGRSTVFNHVDSAWCEPVRAALLDRFPRQSPVEKQGADGIKAGFDRGGVLIKPATAELKPANVVAVVPYRKTDDREPARRWVREYLDNRCAKVVFADSPGEVFSRSAAINAAVRKADPAADDVLAIIDADCFTTGRRFTEGANVAKETGRLVIPHDSVCRMTPEQSREVLDKKCPVKGPTGRWFRGTRSRKCCSGLLFLRFDKFCQVNGFDESLVGWGAEDNCFLEACKNLLSADPVRLDGPLYHLWHERQDGRNFESEQYRKNYRRWQEYRNAGQVYVFNKVNENGFNERSTFNLEQVFDK